MCFLYVFDSAMCSCVVLCACVCRLTCVLDLVGVLLLCACIYTNMFVVCVFLRLDVLC